MDKREVIHALIDKLLDVAESGTAKELGFSFMTLSDCSAFDFRFLEGNGSKEYVQPRCGLYFGNSLESEHALANAFKTIETIQATPDVEPKININLTVEKARELGLIA